MWIASVRLTQKCRSTTGETTVFETNFRDSLSWEIRKPDIRSERVSDVVCFRDAMPLTLRWSVSGSALGRGVPHGNRLTATASGLASIVQAARSCERIFICLFNLASPAGRAR
jgi:hypothetical protein